MSIIGIPHCPHCKKSMNFFRIWGIKNQGEYLCPNCKQISNIYHSPLLYIVAFIAIVSSFFIYYFSKIIFDDVGLQTLLYVFIPYVGFYILSIFLIYLKKPIIRKINRTADGRYFDQRGREMKMVMGQLVYSYDNVKKPEVQNVVAEKKDENLVDIYSLNSEIRKIKNKPSDIDEDEELLKDDATSDDEKAQMNFNYILNDILKLKEKENNSENSNKTEI